jgi:carbamoylphosphate synthase large subunit
MIKIDMPENVAIRVIIYGQHTKEWTRAFSSPELWKKIETVIEILLVNDSPDPKIPDPTGKEISTIIIPLTEQHTKNCPKQYRSLIPDVRSIDIFRNKDKFSIYVMQHKLEHLCPVRYTHSEEIIYPCILKRTDLNAGRGIQIVHSLQHLRFLLQHETWREKEYIVQAMVMGQIEYVSHCICVNGKIVWHCSFAYEMGQTEEIRNPLNYKTISNCFATEDNIAQLEKFLLPLRYSGPCNIDYKIDRNGKLLVFEINPRFGGSLMLPENENYLREAIVSIIKNAIFTQNEMVIS